MSRKLHFGIGLAVLLFCFLWCLLGFLQFMSLAVGRDSIPGASVFDSSFISFYVIWGAVFLGCLWLILRSFSRAMRRAQSNPSADAVSRNGLEQQSKMATPDEKLAHLVKRP
jgi:hypothetical protein